MSGYRSKADIGDELAQCLSHSFRVEGVSMVITQRSEFSAVIQRNGLEGLIAVLRARQEVARLVAEFVAAG